MDETNLPDASETAREPFEDPELYDAVCENIDHDRGFYLSLTREVGGRALEVACGTGRILIPCLKAGISIDGLDLYQPMLDKLTTKAAAFGLAPRLYRADMRYFSLPQRYNLVFIAFNGFTHCLTTDDQLSCLDSCRKHLLPGGCLAITLFYPGRNILTGPEGSPVLEHEEKDPSAGRILRMFDTRSLDWIRQVQHSQVEIQELDGAEKLIASHRFQTDMRWTFKPEMELLLRMTGFPRFEIYGGFDRRPLTQETDLMLILAWNES